MAEHTHKVVVRPWRHEETMVTLPCEECGEDVLVSLPSPTPAERERPTTFGELRRKVERRRDDRGRRRRPR